jgi:EAL domain-containing protein (putative c-di-GMP-specific phosphodiesterase class I)
MVRVPGVADRRRYLAVCSGGKSRDYLKDPYAPGAIDSLYQPIFRLDAGTRRSIGFECLSRGPAGTLFESASALFGFARDAGTVCPLDRACIALGLRQAAALSHNLLFLNVHPETLREDADFPAFLKTTARQCGIPLDRIVIELLEYSRLEWAGAAKRCRSLGGLRSSGVRLALDDVHPRMDDVARVAEYQPDFIKIDGEVLRGARLERSHRHFIVAMLDLADRLGIEVIAEGLENAADLRMVEAAEIKLAQGYYLGMPGSADQKTVA